MYSKVSKYQRGECGRGKRMRSLNWDLKNEQISRGRWTVDRTFQKEEEYVWRQRGMKQYDVFSELHVILLV